jgi:AraC-like DNA-binding protein
MDLDDLRTLLERHARPDGETAIPGVAIARFDRPSAPEVSMSGTVFALIVQGRKTLGYGDRVYDYGAGEYLVASVDLPVTGAFTQAPALGFGLALEPTTVAELLLRSAGAGVPSADARRPAPGIAVSKASPDLIDAVARLVRLLSRPRDLDVLAPLTIREIVWLLISGEQGATVRQFGLADSGLTQIARAVKWIRDHLAEPFRVEDLARDSGMSTSAFHRNFHAVTAMSPIRFQKQLRLQEARLLLAANPTDIAGVGYRVGYESPSQFSREYRRQFGLPPSQDAALV